MTNYFDLSRVNQYLVVVIGAAVADRAEVFDRDLDWEYLASFAVAARCDEADYSVDGFEFGVEFAHCLGGVWAWAVGAV